MNEKKIKNWYAIVAVVFAVFIVLQLFDENFGFYPGSGGEVLGDNAWTLFVYVYGIYVIRRAWKFNKASRKPKSENRAEETEPDTNSE